MARTGKARAGEAGTVLPRSGRVADLHGAGERHLHVSDAGPEDARSVTEAAASGKAAKAMTPEDVREVLRAVLPSGLSRNIVAAGFVRRVLLDGPKVVVEFAPDSRDPAKVEAMERDIRNVLGKAGFLDVQIRRSVRFDDDAMILGGGTLTPLQAEMIEDGVDPPPDLLRNALPRADVAIEAGYGPDGPPPLIGPAGPATLGYDGALPVLQWDIDPHDARAESRESEIRLAGWEYHVWWQVHPCGDLLYASLQALREDWAEHGGRARPHPVGRAEAVNLVYDRTRRAVVAIYGTVRDFRPFVEAFALAYAAETGTETGPATREERS